MIPASNTGVRAGRMVLSFLLIGSALVARLLAHSPALRIVTGTVLTERNEAVPGAIVAANWDFGSTEATTDSNGKFQLSVPHEALTIDVHGKYLESRPVRL